MKLYGFRTNNLVPMKENGKFIHELEGEVHKSKIDLVGHHSITNYRRRIDADDNVRTSFIEAKAEAANRLEQRIEGLQDELKEMKQNLIDLGREKQA